MMDQNLVLPPALNDRYRGLSPLDRLRQLYREFSPDEVLVTSSFGTTSAILLHHIAQVCPEQKIHVIDTGYLFPETLAYQQELTSHLGLEIVTLHPNARGHRITQEEELWKSDPDVCCGINKTMPVEEIKADYKVWMAGLIGFQNSYRKELRVFEEKGEILRFYPIIALDKDIVKQYFRTHNLPRHSLERKGYGSVGCVQCSAKGSGRTGRWQGNTKTECGLHK